MLMAKTGCSRQAELVALFAGLRCAAGTIKGLVSLAAYHSPNGRCAQSKIMLGLQSDAFVLAGASCRGEDLRPSSQCSSSVMTLIEETVLAHPETGVVGAVKSCESGSAKAAESWLT